MRHYTLHLLNPNGISDDSSVDVVVCEGDHGNAPCYPGSKPGILLLDSSPIILFAPHLENDSS